MRVLIVDDSEIALELMRAALVKNAHEVFVSPSAIGVSLIILRERIDVVVIDVELASFRGDRLVDLFRKQRRLDKLGVVLVSGQPRGEVEAIAATSGADAAVSKMEIELLPRAVVRAFNARNPAA
jgi:DNA-binding response OmpR family regulator